MITKIVKPSFTTQQIQDALNSADILVFESGIYRVTKTLQIPSNKILKLGDAVLRRYCSAPVFQTLCTEKTKGYDGAQNVKLYGGTIEGMNSLGLSPTNMLLLFHANNVVISGTTFLDTTGSHAIDIGGCKDVHIIGCRFLGYKSHGADFREAIQIDYAYRGGIPYFKEDSNCFDDTHCDGVCILGCEFGVSTREAQYVAIGTHAQTSTENYHRNIAIRHNIAKGNGCSKYMGFFARIVNMRNVDISDNVVSNYGRFVLIDATPATEAKDKGSRDITIQRNTVFDSDATFKASSVYVNAPKEHPVRNLAIRDNTFDRADSVSIKNTTGLVLKSNKEG